MAKSSSSTPKVTRRWWSDPTRLQLPCASSLPKQRRSTPPIPIQRAPHRKRNIGFRTKVANLLWQTPTADAKNHRRISPSSTTYGGWKSNTHAPHSHEVGNPSSWVTVIFNHCRNGRFQIPALARMTGVCVCHMQTTLPQILSVSRYAYLVSIRHKPNAVWNLISDGIPVIPLLSRQISMASCKLETP